MDSQIRCRGSKVVVLACVIALVLVLLPAYISAQVVGGTLNGTVTESSGAVVPKATILVKNLSTGISHETTTDSAGFYVVPNLVPGSYQVTTSAPGFATEVRSGIVITVGAEQALNVQLKLGAVTETVQVSETQAPIQLSDSQLSNEVNATTVRELPLNGRDWTQLATLQPGVLSMSSLQPGIGGGSGSARGNRGFGTQLAITGGRPAQNNYRIDGISVNDYDNSSPGNVLGAALGTDAIQEFSVVTANYSAEYGRTSGGVVNAVTRSGTNSFHGSAYEFLRNSALDARNYFDAPTIPPFKRNQFGAATGGPIVKDNTFFFVDYEGLRQSKGVTNVDTVPSLDARNGILHNPNGTTTTIAVDPAAKAALALWAPPNGPLLGMGNTGIYSFSAQQVINDNFLTSRFDHRFSDKDSVYGTYQWESALGTLPDSLNVVLTSQKTSHQHVALEENHDFSSQFINTVRGGFNRVVDAGGKGISAINPASADTSLGALGGRDAPQTFVTGLTTLQGGENDQNNTSFWWTSYQAYDDAFLTKGRHSIKFGVTGENDRDNILQFSTVGGQFRFNSLQAFLQNQPSSLSGTIPSTVSPRRYRQAIFGAYVQDDFRWKSNVTLNLGLRYEMSTLPIEANGKLSNLPSPLATAPYTGKLFLSNPTLKNFEPRVGFAWDPFRNGKTAVRAGAGLYDVLPLLYEYALTELQLAPFALTGRVTNLPKGSFPSGAAAGLTAASASRVSYIQPNPPRNYVMQWNLNVQQSLPGDTTAMVAYVGSRGIHQLFRGDDMNEVLPTLTPAGYLWPASGGTVLNPNFGRIDVSLWNSNSAYDALQAQVQKRIRKSLQIQGSYTFAKSIDDGSGSALGDPFSNSISNLVWFSSAARRGLSDFNVKHNLVINYIWDLPSPDASKAALVRYTLGGWQLGGVFQARTGLPFTPLIGGDPLGTKDASPFDYPNRITTGPGCGSAVTGNPAAYINLSCFTAPNPITLMGNAGRNSLIGPGLEDFDFSIFKNNYIPRVSENFNVQFRAEFFNVLNHTNFNPPTDNLALYAPVNNVLQPVAGAGLIDSTSTTAREIQFALKVIF